MRIFLVLVMIVTWVSAAHAQDAMDHDTDHVYMTTIASIQLHDQGQVGNAFLDARDDQKNALLFAFKISPSASRVFRVKRLIFSLSGVNLLKKSTLNNIRIVVDENKNGKADEGEKTVGGPGHISLKDKGEIAFLLHFELKKFKGVNYLLVSDIKDIPYRVAFTVSLSTSGIHVADLKKDERISGIEYSVKHAHGNDNAPVLSWIDDESFRKAGVSPRKVLSGDSIVFGVSYKDADGHAPRKTEVGVDWNGDKNYTRYPLHRTYTYTSYEHGVEYRSSDIQAFFEGINNVSYRFFFSDGEKPAEGSPAKESGFFLFPLVSINLSTDRRAVVGGEKVTIEGFIDYYRGTKVSFDKLKETNFSPWRLNNFALGKEDGVHPRNIKLNRRAVVFTLSLPHNAEFDRYDIPLLRLPYQFKVRGVNRKEKSIGPKITIAKKPIIVEEERYSSHTVVFGGEVNVVLRLRYASQVTVPLNSLKKLKFLPLYVVEQKIAKRESKDIHEIEAHYRLLAITPAYPMGALITVLPQTITYYLNEETKKHLRTEGMKIKIVPHLNKSDLEKIFVLQHSPILDADAFSKKDTTKTLIFFTIAAVFSLGGFLLLVSTFKRKRYEAEEVDPDSLPPDSKESSIALLEALNNFQLRKGRDEIVILRRAFCYMIAAQAGIARHNTEGINFVTLVESSSLDRRKKERAIAVLSKFEHHFEGDVLDEKIEVLITSFVVN